MDGASYNCHSSIGPEKKKILVIVAVRFRNTQLEMISQARNWPVFVHKKMDSLN
jgi:hypothetical protein